MSDFWIESRIDLDTLARQMADEIDNEALVDFIKLVDDRVAEWDFTEKLRDYFNGISED